MMCSNYGSARGASESLRRRSRIGRPRASPVTTGTVCASAQFAISVSASRDRRAESLVLPVVVRRRTARADHLYPVFGPSLFGTRMTLVRSIVAVLVLGTGAATAGGAPVDAAAAGVERSRLVPDTGSRALDSTLALATFDSAWRTVGSSLSGRGVTALDWPAVQRELRPRAARASTDSALRVVVGDMLRRLGESHF